MANRMSKTQRILIPLSGTPLAVLHAALVFWIIRMIYSGAEPDWPMYWHFTFLTAPWLLPFQLLLPASALPTLQSSAQYVTSFLPPHPLTQDLHNFQIPFLIMGILPVIVDLIAPPLILAIALKFRVYPKVKTSSDTARR